MAHICPDRPPCPTCHVDRLELDNAKLRAEVEKLKSEATWSENAKLRADLDKTTMAWAQAADERDKKQEKLEATLLQVGTMGKVVAAAEALVDAKRGPTMTWLEEAVRAYRQQTEKRSIPSPNCAHEYVKQPLRGPGSYCIHCDGQWFPT
jgi:vacuolar-type H+-ATPase subunit I/STV1